MLRRDLMSTPDGADEIEASLQVLAFVRDNPELNRLRTRRRRSRITCRNAL